MGIAAQKIKVKKAIERLYKIVSKIEIETPLSTSDKVALNFWLIDTETLKMQKPLARLRELISAVLDRHRLDLETHEKLLKTCLAHFDPPLEEEDSRMRCFD